MPEEPILSPIEQSRVDTGRIHYVTFPDFYNVMESLANNYYGRPEYLGTIAPTIDSLGPVENRPVANDGSGRVLLSLEYPLQLPALFLAILGVIEVSLTVPELETNYAALMSSLSADPVAAPYVPTLNGLLPTFSAILAVTTPTPLASELTKAEFDALKPVEVI